MRKSLSAAILAATAAIAAPAGAVVINPIFDRSVTGLSNAAQVEAAFGTAARALAGAFTNPVTLNVGVSWGSVGGQALPGNALGASSTALYGYFSYGQMRSWLTGAATTAADRSAVASLPFAAPAGQSRYVLTSAQARALGLIAGNGAALDGSVGFGGNSLSSYDFNAADGIRPGTYDFVGAAEHELSEVMGRISGLSSPTPSFATALDLFRFSATGGRSFGYSASSYFSIDDGRTDLANFNHSSYGGDRGDWLSTWQTNDVADAFAYAGTVGKLSKIDVTALDVIGWGGSGLGSFPLAIVSNIKGATDTPEPAGLALLGVGMAAMAGIRRIK